MKYLLLLFCVISFSVSAKSTFKDPQIKELNCLADNIFHEASAESIQGKQAVGAVTLNRVKSKLYPKSICGVVYQKHKSTCQFSWTCSNHHKYDSNQYAESLLIAKKLYMKKLSDNTKGSLYFHNVYIQPSWSNSMQFTVSYGTHLFYKPHKNT